MSPPPPRRAPMKWRGERQSSNIEDRRGQRLGGGIGGLGLGGIAIVVVIGLLMGKSPLEMLGLIAQQGGQDNAQPAPAAPGQTPGPVSDETTQFIATILGSTEDVWG